MESDTFGLKENMLSCISFIDQVHFYMIFCRHFSMCWRVSSLPKKLVPFVDGFRGHHFIFVFISRKVGVIDNLVVGFCTLTQIPHQHDESVNSCVWVAENSVVAEWRLHLAVGAESVKVVTVLLVVPELTRNFMLGPALGHDWINLKQSVWSRRMVLLTCSLTPIPTLVPWKQTPDETWCDIPLGPAN